VPALEPSAPYVIRPGDGLGVRFYRTPELNVDVLVRPDGKISLDFVGDVQAAGLTPEQLSRTLSERYAGELSNARVTIVVQSFGGQVYVGGEVKGPSAAAFTAGLTALQAIDLAGGFLDTARRDSVILIRREGTGFRGYRLALDKVLSGEDLSADTYLQPSDVIHVPKTFIANVNVFVDQWIRKNLPVPIGVPIPI
jgi:protein involved in polysaccharide export with SLBB domain